MYEKDPNICDTFSNRSSNPEQVGILDFLKSLSNKSHFVTWKMLGLSLLKATDGTYQESNFALCSRNTHIPCSAGLYSVHSYRYFNS